MRPHAKRERVGRPFQALKRRIEEVNVALTQLTVWGNLESHPDTARVSSLSNFYRARFLYRLSQGGEAVEAALTLFVQALQRRAELQTVALEDISNRLRALQTLAGERVPLSSTTSSPSPISRTCSSACLTGIP